MTATIGDLTAAEAAYRDAYRAAAGPNRSGDLRGRTPKPSVAVVLLGLEASPGSWAYGLGRAVGIDPHNVGHILRRLRDLGLVVPTREGTHLRWDGRRAARTHWHLTPAGRDLAALARAAGVER